MQKDASRSLAFLPEPDVLAGGNEREDSPSSRRTFVVPKDTVPGLLQAETNGKADENATRASPRGVARPLLT